MMSSTHPNTQYPWADKRLSFRSKRRRKPMEEKNEERTVDTERMVPERLKNPVERFCEESDYENNVFVMMRPRFQSVFKEIETTIRDVLNFYGLKARFSKDKNYSDESWNNTETCMHGSRYGIVVFEEIDKLEYDPDISLQLGYMCSHAKECLLLNEKNMKRLHTEIFGNIHKEFDQSRIKETVTASIEEWLEHDLGIRKIVDVKIEKYEALLEDENHDVRKSAVDLLGAIESDKAIEPMRKALRDKSPVVRRNAVLTLEEIGGEKAAEVLCDALKDPNTGIRKKTAETLGTIGSKSTLEALIGALGDRAPAVRRSAADALGKIGDNSATKALIEALKDKEPGVKQSVVEALGRIGSERAIGPLIEALKDGFPEVRRSAAEVLGEIGNKSVIPHLAKLKRDEEIIWRSEDESVREAAIQAVIKIRSKQETQ